MQRVIDPRRREQRERMRLARRRLIGAVDDAVVEQRQVRRIEHVAHQEQALAIQIAFEVNAFGEREMNRDRLVRHADFDLHMMVLRQQAQLLAIVVAEQVGPRHGGLEHARTRDETIRAARVDMRVDFGTDTHERIARAHAALEQLVAAIAREGVAQERGVRFVNRREAGDGLGRVVEGFGWEAVGGSLHRALIGIVVHRHSPLLMRRHYHGTRARQMTSRCLQHIPPCGSQDCGHAARKRRKIRRSRPYARLDLLESGHHIGESP